MSGGTKPERSVEEGTSERILGGLEVEALLRLGSEHLFLLFTESRLILAHQGKAGRGTVPMYSFLGKMSEGMRRTPTKKGALEKMREMDPEGILLLHRDNFAVEYPRIVSMKVEPGERVGRAKITLLTRDQKIELYASPVAVMGIREDVVSLLKEKAEYKALNR